MASVIPYKPKGDCLMTVLGLPGRGVCDRCKKTRKRVVAIYLGGKTCSNSPAPDWRVCKACLGNWMESLCWPRERIDRLGKQELHQSDGDIPF